MSDDVSDRSHDVIVIGGGLAGLSTARRLHEAGHDVVVLEARERLGGRTLSRELHGATFDLGGQWVGPTQLRVRALAAELGIELFPQRHDGKKILDVNGKLSSYKGSIPSLSLLDLAELELAIRKLDRMASRVPLDAPHRASEAEDWDGRSVESFKGVVPGARRGKLLIDVGVRTVFGAEPCELSLLYFLFYLNSAGGLRQLVEVEGAAQQDRFVTGAQKLSLGVAGKLDERRIVTNAPVSMITQEASGVAVHSARGVFRARYAVLAVPPHLASRVRFDPPLPPARDGLVQRWPMGATVKAMAFYSRASWRERGLSGEAVVTGGPISVVYDNSSHDGTVSCLLGFVVGRHARAWSKHDPSERRRIALAEFERLLGAPSSEAIDFIEQDWSSEPWTGGCPVASLPPRALSYFGDALRAPAGRVHFAGTETARHWCGYLEGALESAERAAAEVLARLVSELARTA